MRGKISALLLFAISAAALFANDAAQASVEISADATMNMSCNAGVCSPTAKKAVLNVNDLTNMLAAGDVKITTGAGAVTIGVEAPITWTSTTRLTLRADYNVNVKAPITVAGAGGLTIIRIGEVTRTGDLLFFRAVTSPFGT